NAGCKLSRIRPDLAAVEGGAQGEVTIEAERESGIVRPRGRRRDLAVRDPLQPHAELDRAGIGPCKGGNPWVVRTAPRRGPTAAADRSCLFCKRLEDRMLPQRRAGSLLVGSKFLLDFRRSRREVGEGSREDAALQIPDTAIVDMGPFDEASDRAGGFLQ